MSRNKKPQITPVVPLEQTPELMEALGFTCKEMNEYCFRFQYQGDDSFYDWYHTTGATVAHNKKVGNPGKIGHFDDIEELSDIIKSRATI